MRLSIETPFLELMMIVFYYFYAYLGLTFALSCLLYFSLTVLYSFSEFEHILFVIFLLHPLKGLLRDCHDCGILGYDQKKRTTPDSSVVVYDVCDGFENSLALLSYFLF
jgi:hypothetical protein